MKGAVLAALSVYRDKNAMAGLVRAAMEADFGFDKSAEEYARHYLWML